MIKEIIFDVLILLAVLVVVGGERHLHRGDCHGHPPAGAAAQPSK